MPMSDRLVEQLFPDVKQSERAVETYFSQYATYPSVVLLGDPGAGKTHLFKAAAADCSGGRYMTVRQFLNVLPNWSDQTLFIDALDEKRAGRGDDSVVDAMVGKLLAHPPAKLRISCRERDWLGDSDREAFAPFFEPRGGVVVLELGVFTAEEQTILLASLGVSSPEAFLREAHTRELTEYLQNPQNLIMLAEVVNDGRWPETRLELFGLSTRKLLAEHNKERARKDDYGPNELWHAAGAICSLRLISDIDGVSIDAQGPNDSQPGFELLLKFIERDKLRAALGRRIFQSVAEGAAVDYVHRTTAEFVGADWLAYQIQQGLPIERVAALLGVDGHPATELRGLHSWLPVLLPTFAHRFIDADPHGVLTYGDAASLTPTARMHLFDALARLSEADPWFRSSDTHLTEKLAVFCTADLTSKFEAVLSDRDPNRSLRLLVLDALQAGPPPPSLAKSLTLILRDHKAWERERVAALRVLLKLGTVGEHYVVDACLHHLCWTPEDISLKADAYGALFGHPFTAADVAQLLVHAQESEADIPNTTIFWTLPETIPAAAIPSILDAVPAPARAERNIEQSGRTARNASTVATTLAQLLIKLLDSTEDVSPSALWRWMTVLGAHHGGTYMKDRLRVALISKKALLLDLLDERLSALSERSQLFEFSLSIHSTLLGAIKDRDLLERVLIRLRSAQPGHLPAEALYETALLLLRTQLADAPRLLEELYPLGELPQLRDIREAALSCELSEWRRQDALEKQLSRREGKDDRERTLDEFRAYADAIRAGSALTWLGHLAKIYFGEFNDLDRDLAPRSRLLDYFGEVYGSIALEGFVALLSAQGMPSVRDIAEAYIAYSFPQWWLAIVAGLDELCADGGAIESVHTSVLSAGLAINLISPTSQQAGNSLRHLRHEWVATALERNPDVVRDAYLTVAKTEFDAQRPFVNGMHELRTESALAKFRGDVGLSILHSYPNATGQHLQQALECALADEQSRASYLALARGILAHPDDIDEENRDRWLTTGFIADSYEFFDMFMERAARATSVIWLLRDFRLPSRFNSDNDKNQHSTLPLCHLEAVITSIAHHFTAASHPQGVSSGNTNPWDASEYLRTLVNRVSADPSPAASACLARLSAMQSLSTYRDFVLHAAASQQVRRREAAYRQPNWAQAISTLANESPANAPDLHALVVDTLKDIAYQISHANNDIYKRFWNEDSYGRPTDPKPEESCRHVLIDLMRTRLEPIGVTIDPEGHMAGGKRADLIVLYGGQFKIPVELKRNYHAEVWDAAQTQLDQLYTGDPQAHGYGVYGVFWFGNAPKRTTPLLSGTTERPQTSAAMADMLRAMIPNARRDHISILMLDVCGPSIADAGGELKKTVAGRRRIRR